MVTSHGVVGESRIILQFSLYLYLYLFSRQSFSITYLSISPSIYFFMYVCMHHIFLSSYLSTHLSIYLSSIYLSSNVQCLQTEEMTRLFPRDLNFGDLESCWKLYVWYKGQKHTKTHSQNKLLSNYSGPSIVLDALHRSFHFILNTVWQAEVSISRKWKYEPQRN